MEIAVLRQFAARYAKAWCSRDAASVAAFFGEGGSLRVNDDPPAVGRVAITAVAQGFMTAFPDMRVTMDEVRAAGDGAIFAWTLCGANTGPGGAGNAVSISGHETWRFDNDGFIAESKGCFDGAEYARQIAGGAGRPG